MIQSNPAKLAAAAVWHRRVGDPAGAAAIEAQLMAAGRCRRCGRRLTDPTSRERGIGPECVKR